MFLNNSSIDLDYSQDTRTAMHIHMPWQPLPFWLL